MANDQSTAAMIAETTLITRNTRILSAPVHGEIVMMDIESEHYYGLDDIGGVIWQRLEVPLTFGDLIDCLVADYEADPAVIAEDVRKLLSTMAEHKIVTLADGPMPKDDPEALIE